MADMGDLGSKINSILNSPEGMQQLQNMASALGLGNSMPPPAPAPPPPPQGQGLNMEALMGMLQNIGRSAPAPPPQGQQAEPSPSSTQQVPPPPSGMPNLDLNMIFKIQQAMSAFTMENKNVDLLRALRPHLSEARAKKVDDAVRIMQLISLLPLIKQSGIFGLGGENK